MHACTYRYHSKPSSLKDGKVNLEAAFQFMIDVERIPLPNIGKRCARVGAGWEKGEEEGNGSGKGEIEAGISKLNRLCEST